MYCVMLRYYYHHECGCGNPFGRFCLCGFAVLGLTFESLDLETSVLVCGTPGTPLGYLGQFLVSGS